MSVVSITQNIGDLYHEVSFWQFVFNDCPGARIEITETAIRIYCESDQVKNASRWIQAIPDLM